MGKAESKESFRKPSLIERVFNRIFGVLVGLGGGLAHNYLVQVRGRKSGRIYSTPVNLLETEKSRYLVSPRGNTQWVRNLRNNGELSLKKGPKIQRYRVRELANSEKPILLRQYLSRYRKTVQRYFSISPDSGLDAFADVADFYPVFELKEIDQSVT